MRHDFKDSTERVPSLEDFVHFEFHALLSFRVGAVEENIFASVEGANLLPRHFIRKCDAAGGDDVTKNFDAEFAQEKFGDRADGNSGGRFAGGGALEHVAGFGEVVLQGSGEISVARPGRSNAFVLRGIALSDRQGFLPVLPISIFKLDRDGRADGHPLTDAGKNVGGIALDLHAAAAAIALLATPEFTIEEGLVNFQSGGHAGKEGDQSFAVGLSRCEVAQHKFSIVPDARWDQGCGRASVFERKAADCIFTS